MAMDLKTYLEKKEWAIQAIDNKFIRDKLLLDYLARLEELAFEEEAEEAEEEVSVEEETSSPAPFPAREEYVPPEPPKYRANPGGPPMSLRVFLAHQFRMSENDPFLSTFTSPFNNFIRKRMSLEMSKSKKQDSRRHLTYPRKHVGEMEKLFGQWTQTVLHQMLEHGMVPLPTKFSIKSYLEWSTGLSGEELDEVAKLFITHLSDSRKWEWSSDAKGDWTILRDERSIPLTEMNIRLLDGLFNSVVEKAQLKELIQAFQPDNYVRPFLR